VEKKEQSLQVRFFERIKDIIPPSLSIVNEVADVLGVSSDSAYRRLRGETPLSIDEISLLCNHFKIGFDVFSEQAGTVSFNFNQLHNIDDFKNYLLEILGTLNGFIKSGNAELFYGAIDIPLFHHFNYSELSAFKMFYWIKDVLYEPSLEYSKYNKSLISDDLLDIGKQIYNSYSNVPSIEIWTVATLNSTIAQIEFYNDSGLFNNKSVAIELCNCLEEEIKTIQRQAELSGKILIENGGVIENFKLYFSEIEIGNNCILSRVGDLKTVHLSFHTFNKLTTLNSKLCDETYRWLNNIIRKSTLISGVSEKQRYRFFKMMFDKISKLRQNLESNQDK
jgi:hypothetical protein